MTEVYRHPDSVVQDHPNARCACLRCYVKRHGYDHVVAMVRRNCLVDPDGCWTWLKWRNPSGYPIMSIGKKTYGVQRALWIAGLREPVPGPSDMIRQACGNGLCCRPDHSEFRTRSRSVQIHNRHRRKIPEDTILLVRQLRRSGHSYGQIAYTTGLSRGHVGMIVRGRIYADVQTRVQENQS